MPVSGVGQRPRSARARRVGRGRCHARARLRRSAGSWRRRCAARGDWAIRLPGVEPGGWSFEYENDLYPDVDDAAVVALALDELGARPAPRWSAPAGGSPGCSRRTDGWAAFDVDNDAYWLYDVPFCDFGAVIDPPSVDVTAHVVELLAREPGYEEAVRRGVVYLLNEQQSDGSWFGRWGVNYVYGTGAALPALAAAGLPVRPSGDGSGRGVARGHTRTRTAGSARTVAPTTSARAACRLARARHCRRRRRRPGRSRGSSPPARRDVESARPRGCVALRAAAGGRGLGRGALHRNRLPARLPDPLSPLPDRLADDRARPLPRSASVKVYVTGATGSSGSHVARELAEQGADGASRAGRPARPSRARARHRGLRRGRPRRGALQLRRRSRDDRARERRRNPQRGRGFDSQGRAPSRAHEHCGYLRAGART